MNIFKKATVCTLFLASVFAINAEIKHLLPMPQKITVTNTDGFKLKRAVRIDDPTSSVMLQEFAATHQLVNKAEAKATIRVNIVDSIPESHHYTLAGYPDEAYTIDISKNDITINAASTVAVNRAAATLMQLAMSDKGAVSRIEAVSITDWPAFKLRGYMHDVGRSFIDVDELIHEIDLLSRFKINTFHWHFTENQAWRFEVKKYPQLTADSSMTRLSGKFYTQDDCRRLAKYAAERGIIVIPEIDMPGHSKAFERAMGHSMQTDEGVAELLNILEEVAATFPDAPYIHIGADEQRITHPEFLRKMTDKVHSLGKKAIVWNPIHGVNISSNEGMDMTQMWSTAGKRISGVPNIDCRYNYINHFDVFADVIGIYKSNIYYSQQGSDEITGFITGCWNDRQMPTQADILRQNNVYANLLACNERAWHGGGKQYIEKGGTSLDSSPEEFAEFADWERRFLFHKSRHLCNEPIPYVRQTNIRWRITEPIDNNDDTNFNPWQSDGLKSSYTHNGKTISTTDVTGGAIYLRHVWDPIIPGLYTGTKPNHTAYAWTYVYSPKDIEAGALIEFQNYSRSEKDLAPDNGCWDRKGSRLWLNGEEILPPEWLNAGKEITNETMLLNENFSGRPPMPVKLQKGWNEILIKLPYVKAPGVRLNKWMFTFVLTDISGKNALDGITYSPDKQLPTKN